MIVKSKEEQNILRESGRRLARVLAEVARAVRPGAIGLELDALAERLIRAGGDLPAFKNYRPGGASRPFPSTLCVSVNEVVVHGIPSAVPFAEGDIVGLDIGLAHMGVYTDMAVTVPVGAIDEQSRLLIERTRQALELGIGACRAGARVGDIGAAIENFVKPFGYGIVTELGGHGVGRAVHEPPYIANVGKSGTGTELSEGQVLALEPMLTLGDHRVKLGPDRFGYVTIDGLRSAHFEHTIIIMKNGAEIITKT